MYLIYKEILSLSKSKYFNLSFSIIELIIASCFQAKVLPEYRGKSRATL